MDDPRNPRGLSPQRPDPDPAGLAAMHARHARRRLRAEAALDVPTTWEGFDPAVAEDFQASRRGRDVRRADPVGHGG